MTPEQQAAYDALLSAQLSDDPRAIAAAVAEKAVGATERWNAYSDRLQSASAAFEASMGWVKR